MYTRSQPISTDSGTHEEPNPPPAAHSRAGRRILISARNMRSLGGKVILLLNNIPALIKTGWDVTLLAEKHDASLLQLEGVTAVRARGFSLNKDHKLTRFNKQHARMAASGKFDLVVSHGETLRQDILHVHNCRHLEYEEINREYLFRGTKLAADLQARQLRERCFKLVVANSDLMKQDLIQRYGIPGQDIRVVYPGYDAARFHPRADETGARALRLKLGVAEQQRLIGLITSGKLKQRGADLLIEAFARLPASVRQSCHLLIVAKEDFTPCLEQARAAGVAERTHFLQPQADVETLYRALDIYINPARIETFGMALMEAMACGIASVTTRDKVGAAELFRGEMRDLLISEVNAEAIQHALLPLLASEQLRREHGQRCARATRAYSWEANTRQHLEIYNKVVWSLRPQQPPILRHSYS